MDASPNRGSAGEAGIVSRLGRPKRTEPCPRLREQLIMPQLLFPDFSPER